MNITEYLDTHLLFLDGGMGTLLQGSGLSAGELPERWNLSHPDVIRGIHCDYFRAGSHVVGTNTFGANLLKFSPEDLEEIVHAAVQNARAAADDEKNDAPRWVALDIGPLGRMLRPYGDLDFEDAVECFAATVRLGVKYGVDLIMIETMTDLYELRAAVLAAKENAKLPVFASCAFGEDGRLMTGADPLTVLTVLESLGVDAVGVNCSRGPREMRPVVEAYLKYATVPVFFKPNAGLPQVVNGETVYDVSKEEFAKEIAELIPMGLCAAGGCCGTTPEYLAQLTSVCKLLPKHKKPFEKKTRISSYTHTVTFGERPILIGERINPTGKKRFKQALMEGDTDYILKEGVAEEVAGADVLDVNVGLPEIDEAERLAHVVEALQAVTALPLQIDTSDPVAMERAWRRYNGKALINSVNGKKESMDAIFPLVKKYGGVVVALTLDEHGIPETAEGRLAIARHILSVAKNYGIDKSDIIFDPLAMAVSADQNAAKETLAALERIRQELGCHTSLGVSNISFGLPSRETLNATFFSMALERGLSAAIMNPHSLEMQKVYHAYLALSGRDENCISYVDFATRHLQNTAPAPTLGATPTTPSAPLSGDTSNRRELFRAVTQGRAEAAKHACREELLHKSPMEIISKELIPALNTVGEGFEQKKVYLPGLLMAAEAASAAFEVIKEASPVQSSGTHIRIVLATVKGDIHDIGKNIVKLLLENYGFSVIDLGRDVPPEVIVEAVLVQKAPVVGLSALMTTTVPFMEQTIKALKEAAPECRVVVGGAVLNEAYAKEIGADHYARDAMETVRYAQSVEEQLL